MFLQFLASAGQDISQGTGGAHTANAVNQNISSQNYMKLLSSMLGGDIPDGGKLTMDKDGMKLNVPKTALGQGGFGGLGMGNPGSYGGQGMGGNQMGGGMTQINPYGGGGIANPFATSQPGISGADLAGLTPQDITQALSLKQGQEQIGQQSVNTMMDSLYKRAQIQKTYAEINETEDYFPIEVPDIGRVTMDQWKALPKEEQEYAIFVNGSKAMGDSEPLTRREFEMLEPTEREKLLRAFERDPKLLALSMKEGAAGATRISLGEKMAERKAISQMQGEDYFSDPGWVDDINKYLTSDNVKAKVNRAIAGRQDTTNIIAEEKINYLESKIKAGGGIITEDPIWDEDGKTVIWTVKWPTGNTERIRHAIRD